MTEVADCNCAEPAGANATQDHLNALSRQMRFLSSQLAQLMLDETGEERAAVRAMGSELERIIGGRPVDAGAFPECCLIGNSSAQGYLNNWFCTGTLIHPRAVITAEHCITRTHGALNPNSIAIGVDKESDVVPANIIRVRRIVRHPSEDIALLLLHKPADVTPIAMANPNEVSGADRVELVGFGNSDPAGLIGFGIKRQVNVPMNVVRKTPSEDLSDQERVLGFDSFTEFVAGRKGSGEDSCRGDSGGPAYVFVENERKLAGATSRATDEADDMCGDGGVYVRVDAVRDWIDATLQGW